MGDIVGDLNRRRGTVNGMDDRNNAKVIKAFVPLSEMFGYVTCLELYLLVELLLLWSSREIRTSSNKYCRRSNCKARG